MKQKKINGRKQEAIFVIKIISNLFNLSKNEKQVII